VSKRWLCSICGGSCVGGRTLKAKGPEVLRSGFRKHTCVQVDGFTRETSTRPPLGSESLRRAVTCTARLQPEPSQVTSLAWGAGRVDPGPGARHQLRRLCGAPWCRVLVHCATEWCSVSRCSGRPGMSVCSGGNGPITMVHGRRYSDNSGLAALWLAAVRPDGGVQYSGGHSSALSSG
jgi:hypothetical protein